MEAIGTGGPEQSGYHFVGVILKCIFFNKNGWISNKILLNCVPHQPIYDKNKCVFI